MTAKNEFIGDSKTTRNLLTRSISIETNSLIVAANTLTLNVGSKSNIRFSGSIAGQVIKLGNANDYPVGKTYYFYNDSLVDILVNDNNDNLLIILTPNGRVKVVLRNNIP